jgi:DNA polymerase-4
MARRAAEILEKKGLYARTVVLKMRYGDFHTITRSHTCEPATRSGDALSERAVRLLEKTEAGRRPVRLLGVSVHNLSEAKAAPEPAGRDQLDLPAS